MSQQRLSDLPSGASGSVCALSGGKDFASRVAAMGLTVGATVHVVQNFRHGPMIVQVRGTRMALGRGEAAKIGVEVP